MATPRNSFFQKANKALEAEAQKMGGEGSAPLGDGPKPAIPAPAATAPEPEPQQPSRTAPAPTAQVPPGRPAVPPPASQPPTTPSAADPDAPANTPPAPSEEEIALRVLRAKFGDDVDFDSLASRYNQPAELTEDDKKKAEARKEQEILRIFTESGKGTMDDYHAIRELKKATDIDLARAKFFNEVEELDPSASAEDMEEMFQQEFFIGEDFTERQQKRGQKRIAELAASIRQDKSKPIAEIESELTMREEAVKGRKQWEQQVDQFATTQMPKALEVVLGQMGDNRTDLGTFTLGLSEEDQKDIVTSLKDPAFIVRQIQDEKTGKTDLSKLYNLVVRAQMFEKAVKAAGYESYSKGVEKVAGPLHNFPDLRNMGAAASQQTTADAEVQEGINIAKNDAGKILGSRGQTRRKPLIGQ